MAGVVTGLVTSMSFCPGIGKIRSSLVFTALRYLKSTLNFAAGSNLYFDVTWSAVYSQVKTWPLESTVTMVAGLFSTKQMKMIGSL